MTIQDFINENRAELVVCILRVCSNCSVGDDDIEDFISNDESLYNWALREGVDI